MGRVWGRDWDSGRRYIGMS